MNTQRDLEAERAELMARNHMLEEQLHESQEYIEKHLAKSVKQRTTFIIFILVHPIWFPFQL